MLDTTRPGVRQLGSAIGMAVALVALWLAPGTTSDPAEVLAATIVVAVATVAAFALPWHRWHERWVLVLPLVSLAAFALLRLGTGGSQSVFSSLLILPIVWIAAERGRSMVAVCAAAAALAMALPFVVGAESVRDAQVVRVLFAPFVFALMAGVVNELARRARQQVAEASAIADERAAMLAEAERGEARAARAVDELREAEAFTRSVWLAVTHQAVVITDLEGRVVEWNPGAERLLGVSRDEARGRLAVEFLRPGHAGWAGDLRFEELVGLAEEGTVADGLRLRAADGRTVPVDVTYSRRLDRDGVARGYILVAHDMTQAHDAARLKDEFVGTVSHELRTPLSSVLGYLELLRDDEAGLSDTQRHYVAVAERNANRLLGLVGDLLFVAQVDAGRFPMQPTRVDLTSIVRASAESALPQSSARDVAIVVDVHASHACVHGDATRLAQAVDNLVSNAVKFTPKGGTVTLDLRRDGDDALLAVVDTGMGIPADEMQRLFTRFFRSTTATRQAVKGVGLGLTITRAIVEAHGGRLSAHSEEGVGTTFEMRLPTLDDEDRPGDKTS
ncbi:sensor histidine kinase [Agrococcus sp. SGAir0287]|uniref:sensor histidine kinase n=1 Tax=Agrococcus sp. SGAir0287 TaxID=2070347 RepID=UPI001586DB17|nr:ATP-binding protein [Agrococcus sp. SGAir0287]